MNLEEPVKISFNSTQARRRKLKIAAANTGMSQTDLLNYLVDVYCDKVTEPIATAAVRGSFDRAFDVFDS